MRKRTKVGEFLIDLRTKHSENVGNMAKRLGVTRSTISAIEWGHRDLSKALQKEIIKQYKLNYNECYILEEAMFYSANAIKIDMNKLTKGEKKKIYGYIKGRLL